MEIVDYSKHLWWFGSKDWTVPVARGTAERLLLFNVNGFTERVSALKVCLPRKKSLSVRRKMATWVQTGLTALWGRSLCFHLQFPALPASECFLNKISPDRCAAGTLLIAGSHITYRQTAEHKASSPADKNSSMNCYYCYPILHLSNGLRVLSTEEPADLSAYLRHIKSKY